MTILQPISRVYHSQSTIKDSKNHFRKSQNVRQRLVEGVRMRYPDTVPLKMVCLETVYIYF